MIRVYNSKFGETQAIADFHKEAEAKGITIRKFRLDHSKYQITVRAVDFSK